MKMKERQAKKNNPAGKYRTPKDIIQYSVCAVILKFLYHGLRVLYRHDERVRQDLDRIERGTTIRISCSAHGPSLEIAASENGIDRIGHIGRVNCTGCCPAEEKLPDIDIRFKSADFSFAVFTGRIGIAEAFSGHMMYVNGDFSKIMPLVRCMEQAERYLFPSFIGRRILKTLLPKKISSLRLYASILFSMLLR